MITRNAARLVRVGVAVAGVIGAGCAGLVGLDDAPPLLEGNAPDGALDATYVTPEDAEQEPSTTAEATLDEPPDAPPDAGPQTTMPEAAEAQAPDDAAYTELVVEAGALDSDAATAAAAVLDASWCAQPQQQGSKLCADFDESPDAPYAAIVSTGGSDVDLVNDAGYSAPAALASTLVAPAQASLSAELTTNLSAVHAGMFVLNFELWIDPGCEILPLQKVFLATLTSDQTSFYGPVLLSDGNGSYEVRPAHLTGTQAFVLDLGVSVGTGTWLGVHYAYCPSVAQDSVSIDPAPAACQTPPMSGIAASTLAVGLRSDFEEGPIACTVLYDNVSLDEY